VDDNIRPEAAPEEPVPEKVPGLRDYKKMMRQFFTVQRQTVSECGHKFNDKEQPRNNCIHCWFAFFNLNGEFTKSCDELWRSPGGQSVMVGLRGTKFVKMFCRFMSTIARWKAEEEAMKGLNEQGWDSSSANIGAKDQGESVQIVAGIGEESQREAKDNNVSSEIGG
jgi:hypothetical protein